MIWLIINDNFDFVMIFFNFHLWKCVKCWDFASFPYRLSVFLPRPPPLLSVGASPSPARHSGSAPATIWLRNVIWNSHTLEVDTAGAISQHSQGAWGGSCKVVVLVAALLAVAGELLAQTLAAFRGNTWQIRDLSGKKCSAAMLWMFWLLLTHNMPHRSLERAVRMGGGHIGLLFLSLFLSVFLISFCLFLAVSGCLLDPRLRAKEWFYLGWWGHFAAEIIQTLVRKRGVLVSLGWVGGRWGTTIAAQSDCRSDKKM